MPLAGVDVNNDYHRHHGGSVVNPARVASSVLPKFAPDSGSFTLAVPQWEALAALHAGVVGNLPFLLLTGDAGTGKTTVARGLLERLDPDRYALGGMFGPYGEGDALLAHMVQDFAVQPHRSGDNFLTLKDFLGRCGSGGREAVLVIDEAQALDAVALRQLWHLVAPPADRRPLLQLVLVGVQVPAAVEELACGSEWLPIGARIHLRRMREAETRDFVLHQLRCGGWAGLPAFGPDALIAIHERSAGVVRRASLLCDRILMWLELEGVRDVSAQVVHAVDTQVRGEWSELKSEESAAQTVEPRTAAWAGVPHLTAVRTATPAPTAQATASPGEHPTVARLASAHSSTRGLAPPSDETTATSRQIAPPPEARLASAHPPTPGLAPPSDAPPHAPVGIQADLKAAQPAVEPPPAAAPNAETWHRLLAMARQGRIPMKLFAGLLLLGLAVLVGLAMQWALRAPPFAPASHRATSGSTVQMPDRPLPQTQGQQPVIATPAAPSAALPATSPPPRLLSRPPPATTTAPRADLAAPSAPTPAPAGCGGTAVALGLCAVAISPQPEAPAEPTTAAPRVSAPACAPERVALGLCDAP